MQSDVLRIFVLGDFNISQSFLHRIIFGEAIKGNSYLSKSFDENRRELPHGKYACSYLLDNNLCYTLQFWEIGDRKGLQQAEAASYPSPDLIVLLVADVCSRNSLKNSTSLLSEVKNKMPNVPQLIIAAKVNFPRQTMEIDSNNQVSMSEVRETASTLGALSVECCPDSGDGVLNATSLIIRMAVYGQKPNNKRKRCPFKRKQHMRPKHFFPETLVIDPSGNYGMENAPKCPGVNVLVSTCEADLAKMRKDTSCLDVRFTFQGSPHSPPIEAHQVILISSAPQLFEEIFTGQTKSQISGRQHELFEKVSWPKAQSGHSCNNNSKNMVEIHVCDKVARQEFVRLLEFLYMGASIADLQKTDSIYELLAIAKTFNLTQLLEACENVLEGNEMENSVKSSFVGGGRATVLRDMFFDKPLLDDLVFQIQGSLIYAHQVVVIARCRVLAEKIAKFKQDYPGSVRVKVEIDEVTMETFKRLLEFLYTDDVKRNLQQDTLLELLELASTYQLPRLVTLCEYLIIVNLNEDSSCERIINIFLVAKESNANQLSKWCLNLFARNYYQFSACNQYKSLSNQDKDYIEQHQWPQRCVLSMENSQALREFIANRNENRNNTTCCVVS